MNVLYGKTGTGFDGADTLITQESAGVPSSSSKGGIFGASLDGGSAGTGFDMLAIGSAKEYVWVLKGASGTGSMLYTQNSEGVFGAREVGDAFGAFVRFLASGGTGTERQPRRWLPRRGLPRGPAERRSRLRAAVPDRPAHGHQLAEVRGERPGCGGRPRVL